MGRTAGWLPLATLAVLGGAAGGAAAGAAAGLLGGLLPHQVRVGGGTLVACVLVVAPLVAPSRLPQLDRETEQSLLGRSPYVWAVANAALLGMGFTSRIGYWTYYLVSAGSLLTGSPRIGALVWGLYGLTRMGIAGVVASRMHRRPDHMGEVSRRLVLAKSVVRRVMNPVTTLLAVAVAVAIGG